MPSPSATPSGSTPGNPTPPSTVPNVPSAPPTTTPPVPPAGSSVTPTPPTAPPATSTAPSTTTEPVDTEPSASTEPTDNSSAPPSDTSDEPPSGGGDCSQLLLCEDFESANAPDPAKWSLVANYTYDITQSDLIRVGTEQKHGGSKALRVDANGLAGILADIPAQKFYVRAFMRVDAAPLGPVLMAVGADHNSELRFRIQQNSWGTINIVPSDSVLPQAAREGNCPTCPQVTANEWFCMEFFVDAATKSAGLWLNGVETEDASGIGDFPNVGNPVRLRFGTMDLQGGSTGVWVDDIKVGTQRLGCE